MIKKIPIKKISLKPEFKVNISYEDYNDTSPEVFISFGKAYSKLSFEINELPNCCGLWEIGRFDVSSSKVIPEVKLIQATKDLLIKILKVNSDYRGEISFLLTLSQEKSCKFMREVLKDEKIFTKVKSFKNLNSNNIVEIYINN